MSYDFRTPNLNLHTGTLNRDPSSYLPLTMTTDDRVSIDPFLDHSLTLNLPKSDRCFKISPSGLSMISLYNEISELWKNSLEEFHSCPPFIQEKYA